MTSSLASPYAGLDQEARTSPHRYGWGEGCLQRPRPRPSPTREGHGKDLVQKLVPGLTCGTFRSDDVTVHSKISHLLDCDQIFCHRASEQSCQLALFEFWRNWHFPKLFLHSLTLAHDQLGRELFSARNRTVCGDIGIFLETSLAHSASANAVCQS